MTGEKEAPDHIVNANKMVDAPAEMPGVEEIARAIASWRHHLTPANPYRPSILPSERAQADAVMALFAPILAEKERLTKEREALVMMAGGGLRSLAAMMKHTFAGRGVEITDEEADRAARQASELIVHSAMAGNPKEWCLSCGTVSGDGQCHCTEPFAASDCNRQARHHLSEMASEAQAAEARALAAEAALAAERERCALIAANETIHPLGEQIAAAIRAEGE